MVLEISLSVAFIVIICGSIIGSAVGIASGMAGGLWDEIAMRLVDLVYAIPFLLIALVAAVVFGASFRLVLILLTIFSWPIFARQTRGLTLQLKNMDYVASSRVAGASGIRIAFNHILPGVFNTIVVIATLQIGSLILTRIGALVSRRWHPGTSTSMGEHGCRRSRVHHYCMVGTSDAGNRHLPHRLRL